jgi:hypothetical protein
MKAKVRTVENKSISLVSDTIALLVIVSTFDVQPLIKAHLKHSIVAANDAVNLHTNNSRISIVGRTKTRQYQIVAGLVPSHITTRIIRHWNESFWRQKCNKELLVRE